MNAQRNLLVVAMSGLAVLAVLLAVALAAGPAVAASQAESGSVPVPTGTVWPASAPVPPGVTAEDLSPPDLPSPAGSDVEDGTGGEIEDEDELKPPAAASRTGEDEDAPDFRFSSVPVPPGTPMENLSPPDLPLSAANADEAAAPLASYFYLRVAGSVLRPRGSDVEWLPGGDGGCIYASSGSTSRWWNTPVYLWQGATIKYLRMYYNDTSASNCQAYFTVYDLDGDIVDEWGVQSSGTPGNDWQTSSEFTHTVDYTSYSYVINWQPNDTGSDMQLCGFRVFYYPPTFGVAFLPSVMKNFP